MRGGSKKYNIRYIISMLLFILILEIVFKKIDLDWVWALGIIGAVTKLDWWLLETSHFKKAQKWFAKGYKAANDLILGGNIAFNLHNLIVVSSLRGFFWFLKPLFRKKTTLLLFAFSLGISPLLAMIGPYRLSVKAYRAVSHQLVILLEVDDETKVQKEQNVKEMHHATAANPAQTEEENNSANHDTTRNENNGRPKRERDQKDFHIDFLLKDNVTDEEIERVKDLIFYQSGMYAVQAGGSETLLETMTRQFSDIAQKEPTYMEEFFPKSDQTLTESYLYIREEEFYKQIEQGKRCGGEMIPDNSILDEVISGRKGQVRKTKSHRMAAALANNYLEYVLQYSKQFKNGKNQLYYAGMAILAGQLQLCYADTEAEQQEALEWIYQRYHEIEQMKIAEDSERVTEILSCLRIIKTY